MQNKAKWYDAGHGIGEGAAVVGFLGLIAYGLTAIFSNK